MNRIGLLSICVLLASGVFAQEVRTITLSEAIELGYANSKQLAISKAKVQEAQAKLDQAKDRQLPDVSVGGNYMHINTPTISMANASDGGGSSGGESPLAAFSNLHDIGLVQVTASMPIYNGLKIRNTRVMNEYLSEASHYDEQTTKSEVSINTIKAIYQYYELLESRKVIEENLRQQQQLVEEFKNKEAQGVLARNDRLKTELQANRVELGLTEVNHTVELAAYNLNILLGLPESTVLQLDTAGLFMIKPTDTWDSYLNAGLSNRSDIKSASLQVKAADTNYKIAKSARYPTVGISTGYVNAYVPNVFNVYNALNAGLSLKYSITGAFHATHGIREARSRADQAASAQALQEDNLRIKIRGKYLRYLEMQDKLVINDKSVRQAQENYQISDNKYNQGLMLLSDYLDANVSLLRSRLDYATGRAETMVAYYELQESIGALQ
ncbi:TolC family protein [Chryseolinea sp. T2]|uniref:TolC family protein n=1 Tax=Chryseolinea sp. T2 TaxID=3129255 RepID=UPI003077D190